MISVIRWASAPLLLAALAAPLAAMAQKTAMPAELIGMWSDDTEEGRAQCADYRRNPRPDADGYDPLVGSVLIRNGLIHSYSDYGEGNFYRIVRLAPAGPKSWRVISRLYLDTMPSEGPVPPGGDEPIEMADTLTLKGGLLVWESSDADTRTLFRCGNLPR